MSFAAEFGKLFASIFGIKPRIKRSGRGWVCFAPDGRQGFGVNPRMAYGAWQALAA